MSFHGVQIDKPRAKDRPILKTTSQMMYQRYVSKKNNTRSMIYMIVSAKGMWFRHRAFPKILSLQFSMFVRAMTETGLLKEDVKKKYDSAYLHPKINSHRQMDAARALPGNVGYDAVKVWEATYLRDFPATRSPNIRPEGMIAKAIVTTTEMKNWTIPRMRGI